MIMTKKNNTKKNKSKKEIHNNSNYLTATNCDQTVADVSTSATWLNARKPLHKTIVLVQW